MLVLPINFNRITFKKLNILKLIFHLTVFLFCSGFNTVVSQEIDVQAGKKLFNANCAACHKLNKKAVGPALKGVSAKYDREWLYSWIKNSAKMIKSGDVNVVLSGGMENMSRSPHIMNNSRSDGKLGNKIL